MLRITAKPYTPTELIKAVKVSAFCKNIMNEFKDDRPIHSSQFILFAAIGYGETDPTRSLTDKTFSVSCCLPLPLQQVYNETILGQISKQRYNGLSVCSPVDFIESSVLLLFCKSFGLEPETLKLSPLNFMSS